MNELDIILEQIQEKIMILTDGIVFRSVATFDEYNKIVGEVKGLRTAEGYINDLKQQMEHADE